MVPLAGVRDPHPLGQRQKSALLRAPGCKGGREHACSTPVSGPCSFETITKTLHPTPHTPHPTPYTLHPATCRQLYSTLPGQMEGAARHVQVTSPYQTYLDSPTGVHRSQPEAWSYSRGRGRPHNARGRPTSSTASCKVASPTSPTLNPKS